MIRLTENNIYFDIRIGNTSLDDSFVKTNGIEIIGFRIVYTAGLALPTVNLIMITTNKDYSDKFRGTNNITFVIGTDPMKLDTFEVYPVGNAIKPSKGGEQYLINWGGVFTKNLLDTTFLTEKNDGYYQGSALNVLMKAWKENTNCGVRNECPEEIYPLVRPYRRQDKQINLFLADVLTHVDLRPSFPLVTIDKNCNLLIRDFQTLKKIGPKVTFAPANKKSIKDGEIGYASSPSTHSFKTYSNRKVNIKEIGGRNVTTGKLEKTADSLKKKWAINKLANTNSNEDNPREHKVAKVENAFINSETPMTYHEVGLHNRYNLIDMSSVQTNIRVENTYLNNIEVLDLVNLKTDKAEDPISGQYIVEAIEQGFVRGTGFSNIIWMCRENNNDVERSLADPYANYAQGYLTIDSATKAKIASAVSMSRKGLAHVRGYMDGTYIREWEKHLVTMRYSALSNFNFFGSTLDLNSGKSTIATLKNNGAVLFNKLLRMFIKDPYASLFINVAMKDQTTLNLFTGLLQLLFGAELYANFYQIVADLIYFDEFLDNYKIVVNQADKILQPDYVEEFLSGRSPVKESVTGEFIADLFRDEEFKNNLPNYRRDMTTMVTPDEKVQTTAKVVNSIKQNIPSNVDIPIPEITLSDSDAIKPIPEITDIIVNEITNSLIEKGYVYDSMVVDGPASAEAIIIKPDGTKITAAEAKSTMVSSNMLKQMLSGTISFDTLSAKKIEATIGNTMRIRHWGAFSSENELVEHLIKRAFTDKYKTLNCTKRISVLGGKRIFVALPASEENVIFYINSERVIMGQMSYEDMGYRDARGYSIPYIIYYTPESYNNSNVMLEMRKGG